MLQSVAFWEGGNLKPRQLEAAKLLAHGLSVDTVAQTIGVDRSNVHRWLQDKEFQALVASETAKRMEQLETELQKLNFRALSSLSQSLDRLEQLARLAHEQIHRSQGDDAIKWVLAAAKVEQVISNIALKRFADWGKHKGFEISDLGNLVASLQLNELDEVEGDNLDEPET